jgi:hypothetical protein
MPLLDPIPFPVEDGDSAVIECEPLRALVADFAASPADRDAILSLRSSIDEWHFDIFATLHLCVLK